MSNKLELQSNNLDLQSILDTINSLPEAGGSSGATLDDIGVFTFSETGNAKFNFLKGMTFGELMASKMTVCAIDSTTASGQTAYTLVSENGLRMRSVTSGGGTITTGILSKDGTENGVVTENTIIEEIQYNVYDEAPF